MNTMADGRNAWLEAFTGRSIAVTGAAGYLGSALVRALASAPCRILALHRRPSPAVAPNDGVAAVEWRRADIREPNFWDDAAREADIIFHLAAQTSAYEASRDPLADLEVNTLPVLRLLEACRQCDRQPIVVFAGTVTQVGLPETLPVGEDVPDRPVTIYDVHKLISEKYLQQYAWDGIVEAVTLRLANVYGPGPRGRADRGILNLTAQRAVAGEPLQVYGEGAFVRDYVYIDDVVNAFIAAAAWIEQTNGQFYLVGSGTGHRIIDAVALVADRAAIRIGRRPPIEQVPIPAGLLPIERRNFVADIAALKAATGWTPRVDLQEGVDQTIDYYLAARASVPCL